MALEKVGYAQVTAATGSKLVKAGPGALFALLFVGGTSSTVTVYDGTDTSGAILFAKGSVTLGDVVHFGGGGVTANKGLFVVVSGTDATVNIAYT